MVLRSSVDAILVGGETIRMDNPRLTIRGKKKTPQPWRIIWTKSGKLPAEAHVLTDRYREKTLVLQTSSLHALLKVLGKLGITSVLIEGGGYVLGQAFDHGLVDEVSFYLAPLVTGGPTPAVAGLGVAGNDAAIQLGDVRYERLGDDISLTAKVLKS